MLNYMFSIIVPVYNVEKYIERCVNSLINQNYDNIEVLLIDDGSQDRSAQICDEYSKEYSFIHSYHKQNGGLSDARNYGLKRASGDYVFFIDSDDYISATTCFKFNELLNNYHNVEVVAGTLRKHYGEKIVDQFFEIDDMITDGREFIIFQLKHNTMHVSACRYVYKREFLIRNKLEFTKGILHEDEHWTLKVLLKTKILIVTNYIFYHHIIRTGSITQQKTKRKNADDIIAICKDHAILFNTIDNKELRDLLLNYLATLYFYAVYIGKFDNLKEVLDKGFLKKNSISVENKIRLRLLFTSQHIFYFYTFLRLNYLNKSKIEKVIKWKNKILSLFQ